MREVKFGPESKSQSSHHKALNEEIKLLEKHGGKIFRIHSRANNKPCVLVTTSAQISLGFNRFSAEAQEHLCMLIVEESKADETNEGLLIVRGKRDGAMFVTTIRNDTAGYAFHLSPVNGSHFHDDENHGHGGGH